MTVVGDLEAQVPKAEEDARGVIAGLIADVVAHLIKTHFTTRSGSGPNAPRNELNVASLTASEAQTLADVLAGADMPEDANDTIRVCADQCAAYGVDTVDGFTPTPKPKKKSKAAAKK